MNSVMPGTFASSGCRRRMTSLALIFRVAIGFKLIRMRPLFKVVLVPSIPMKEDKLSTAGSCRMILVNSCCCRDISGNDTDWPLRRPLNDAGILNGKESFGNYEEQEDRQCRESPAATSSVATCQPSTHRSVLP